MNKKQTRGIRLRLSLTEVFYNGCFASANFMTVFLQSLGIGAGQIGIVTSLTNVMNIVSQPVWGMLSDRIRSVRKCFALTLILGALCVLFVPALSVAGAMVPMMVLLVLQYFFLTPANMLMELWLVKVNNTPKLGISYGSIRTWASLGFALMNLAYVPILKVAPVRSVYYFYVVFAVLAAVIALRMPAGTEPDSGEGERVRFRDLPFRQLLTYWIVSYLVFEVIFQIAFSWRNTYMVYAVNEFGIRSESYGAFQFLSGMLEIPMLLLCGRLIKRAGLAVPLLGGTLMLAAEFALYALGTSMPALLLSQVFKGFGYALYVACRHQYVERLAPAGLKGSTQAMVNAAYAGVNIVAAMFGGFLLENMGTRGFFGMISCIQFSAAAFLVLSQVVGLRVLGKKLPSEIRLWR